jgi:peptide/nickel transport system substrate-binding protein
MKNNGLMVDRRQLLAAAAALGLSTQFGTRAAHAEEPVKGGMLRLGMEGGSASDSLDPTTYADSIPIAYSLMFWNCLVEIGADGTAQGEVLESWEAKPGATEWVFNVRKDLVFGSGKALTADDVIFSINMHRGENTKSPSKPLLEPITEIKKLTDHQIAITLSSGNADLPYVLSDYHLLVVPDGTTDFSKPDGTGAYTLESWEPGVRVLAKRKDGAYWKAGRGNFDSVELRYILDAAARTQALITGQVDAVNRLDPKTAGLVMKSNGINVVRTPGTGFRYAFVAHVDKEPFNNADLMMALKLSIDRQKIVDNVFAGFASIGNDHLIAPNNPFFDPALPQHAYDPAKAAELYKKSGHSGPVNLKVSEGAFSGATDAAVIFQESAKAAGIELNVERVSGDGYWDNVWLKEPFSAVYWGTRPTADLAYSTTFLSDAPWNDTKFQNAEFDKIIVAARAEIDNAKRKEMYAQAQKIVAEQAGMICFAIGDFLDGYSTKVRGNDPHARYDLNDQRLAEKGWFAA